MDYLDIINYLPPYALHAALLATVVLSATLVFVFSFRNVGEPAFSERKSSTKKKKQPKEKKALNGHAVTVSQGEKQTKAEGKKEAQKSPVKNSHKVKPNEGKKEKSSEKSSDKQAVKEKGQAKEKKGENVKNSPKEAKVVKTQSKGKENVEEKEKNKKKLLRLAVLKPKETNDGWEQAISRKERRARKALLEDPNLNLDTDLPRSRDEKGSKKEKDSTTSEFLKTVPNEEINQPETDVKEIESPVTVTTTKKNPEPKQKQSTPSDEPPVGSSTVYDEFAEVFKEPSKKAIKKRVRKE